MNRTDEVTWWLANRSDRTWVRISKAFSTALGLLLFGLGWTNNWPALGLAMVVAFLSIGAVASAYVVTMDEATRDQ